MECRSSNTRLCRRIRMSAAPSASCLALQRTFPLPQYAPHTLTRTWYPILTLCAGFPSRSVAPSAQHSVTDGTTAEPHVYAPSVCARLRGLVECDGVRSTCTIQGPSALSALGFLGKVPSARYYPSINQSSPMSPPLTTLSLSSHHPLLATPSPLALLAPTVVLHLPLPLHSLPSGPLQLPNAQPPPPHTHHHPTPTCCDFRCWAYTPTRLRTWTCVTKASPAGSCPTSLLRCHSCPSPSCT